MPLSRAIALIALVLIIVLSAGYAYAQGGEAGVNLYGLSYHLERDRAKELGYDNEINPGIGLRYRFPGGQDLDWFGDGGAYRDSGRSTAVYAGGGILWKLTENLRLGGALTFFYSDSYNHGDPFIAPIPLLVYDWRAVSFNIAYFPKISGFNDLNTLGFWLTLWPKR